ncbi:MAG: DUF3093 domain-containing protein [Propionibacteriaceae bacterium]|nr:DUF3093 domain-containing protein [Propionibacteriaceae bacterium]
MLYHERLHAPLWYWLVGIIFAASTVWAVGFWYGPAAAVGGALVVIAAITIGVAWVSRTDVAVDANGLRVGPSVIEWPWVGEVEVLDAEATRERLGVGADARAHLALRPWLTESVLVQVNDDADPHPYWLIGSRTPHQLAAAIASARQGSAA